MDAEKSTGARLREALEANHQLALEHARCLLEIRHLRRQLAVRGGDYHLTDKGRAAIAQPADTENQEQHP